MWFYDYQKYLKVKYMFIYEWTSYKNQQKYLKNV